jgi:hypothetical protein
MLLPYLRRLTQRKHRPSSPGQRPARRKVPATFRPRFEMLEDRTLLNAVHWANPVSGNWNTASNWENSHVPVVGDTAIIDAAGTNYTVTLDVNPTVDGITLNSANATFSASSRTLTVNGPATLSAATVLWTSSTWAGTGTLTNGAAGTLVVQGSSTFSAPFSNAMGGTLRVQGYDASSSTTLTIANGFTNAGAVEMTNASTATRSVFLTVNSGLLTNTGSITTLAGSAGGGRTIAADLLNSGTVNVNTDTTFARTNGTYANAGALNIAAGRTLNISGSAQTFNQNGGTLNVAGTFSLSSGAFGLNGGALMGTAPVLTSATLSIGAGATATGVVVVQGSSTLSGDIAAGQTIRVQGYDASASTTLTVANGFTNAGAVELTNASTATRSVFLTVNSGVLTNTGSISTATLAGAAIGSRILTAQLDNHGTFTVGAATTLSLRGASVTSGTISVSGADLTINQAVSGATLANSGAIAVSSGRTLTVSSIRFDPGAGGTISGAGSLALNSATLGTGTLSGIATVVLTGTGLAGDASLTNATLLAFQGTATFAGNFSNAVGGTLRVQGYDASASTTLTVANGFTNAGAVELTNASTVTRSVFLTVNAGVLTNTGSIAALAGSAGGGRTIAADLLNSGTMNLNTDTTFARTNGAYANAGTLNIAAGRTLSISGSGQTFNQNGGTLNVAGTFSLSSGAFGLNGGALLGTAPVLTSAALRIGAGSTATGVVVVQGSSTLSGDIAAGQTIRVQGSGSGSGSLTASAGFTNAGTIELTSTNISLASLTVSAGTLTNTGIINVNAGIGGARTIAADLLNSGTVNLNTNTTFSRTNGVYTNAGNFNIAASQLLTISGSGQAFNQNGGTLNVAGSFGLSSASFGLNGGALAGNAPVLTSAALSIGAGSTVSGLLVVQASSTLSGNIAAGQTIRVQGSGSGSGSLTASAGFTNAGTIELTSTNISLASLTVSAGTLTNTGTISALAGAGGSRTLNATLDNQGLLTGVGTVTGSVTNSGQVSPGNNGPGTFTVTGTFTQTATGALNIKIGGLSAGSQYDRLAVSGAANLNGTLNVSLINGFFPSLGDHFDILTYGSHTNDFATRNGLNIGGGRQLDPTAAATTYTLVTHPGTGQMTNTALVSSINPSVIDQSVTFTATVSPSGGGTPTGTVTFRDGNTPVDTETLSGGMASYTTGSLAAGSHALTAVYSGDATFAGSTSPILTQTVTISLAPVKQHLASVLDSLEGLLNNRVLQAHLPILDNQLQTSAASQVFAGLHDRAQAFLQALPDNPTNAQIVQMLRDSFSSLLGGGDIAEHGDHSSEFVYELTLHQDVTASVAPLRFDVGLPGLGFQVQANTAVNFGVGFTFHFQFGVNSALGLFLDVPFPNELTLMVNATVTGALSASLGFVTLNATSTGSGTHFDGTYAVNLVGPAGSGDRVAYTNLSQLDAHTTLNGSASVRLDLDGSFGPVAVSPRLGATFALDWSFVNADPQSSAGTFGQVPTVALQNVKLDLGPFFSAVARPIVQRVHHVTRPLEKVVSALDRPIPGLDRLHWTSPDSPPTFLDLLVNLTGTNRYYFDAVERVVNVVKALDETSAGANVWIDLGSFDLNANGVDARQLSGPEAVPVNVLTPPATAPLDQARSQGGGGFLDAAQTNMPGGGLHFPILEDPHSAMKLFFHQITDLFSFNLPSLRATYQQQFSYDFIVPPGVPLTIRLGGSLSFNADLKFGFDSSGLAAGNVLDGFFVDLRGIPGLFTLQGGLQIAAGLGTSFGDSDFGVSVIIGGALNLTGTVNFNPLHTPADGKLRFTQIQQDWDAGIGCIFAASGNITIGAEFFGEGRIDVDLLDIHESIRHRFFGFERTLFDFGSLGVETGEPQPPQTLHWTGQGGSTDWNNADNWEPHAVPRPEDDVVIGRGYVVLNVPATVHSLTLTGGVLTGSNDLTVSGLTTWQGGTLGGTGRLLVNGGLEISGDNRKTLDGRHLVNAGNAVWKDGGEIFAAHGAVWDNQANAVLDIRTSAGIEQGSGARLQINNTGTIRRSMGTGTLALEANVVDAGTMDVQTGAVSLEGSVSGGGVFNVAANARLDFDGDTLNLTSTSQVTGAGTINFSAYGAMSVGGGYGFTGTTNLKSGTLTFSGTSSLHQLALQGGKLVVSGTLTVTDQLTWTEGGIAGSGHLQSNGPTTLSSANTKWIVGATFDNAGTATWTDAGSLLFMNGATWHNLAGSVLDARSNSELYYLSGAACSFVNDGLFTKSAGTGITYVNVPLNQTGTVQVQTGTLNLAGGGTVAGSWTLAAGAGLEFFAGTYALANGASVTGAGLARVTGATVNGSGTLTLENWEVTGGSLSVTGTLNTAGTGRVSAGTLAVVSGTLNVQSLTVTGGTVTLADAVSAANWDVSGGAVIVTGTLASTGTDRLTAGSVTVSGATTLQDLTLAGGTLSLGGATTVHSLSQSSGTLTGGGTLTIPDAGAFAWTGGTQSGAGQTLIGAGATLTISGPGAKNLVQRSLSNAGNVTWTAGTVTGSEGATVTNQSGATFTVSDATFAQGSGAAAVFTNAGTFRKSGVGTTATFGVVFNHTGTAEVQAGTLNLSGGGTHTGPYAVDGLLEFAGGPHTIAGALSGAGTAWVIGTVTVNGPVTTGSFLSVGGTLNGPVTVTTFETDNGTTINGVVTAQAVLVRNGTTVVSATGSVTTPALTIASSTTQPAQLVVNGFLAATSITIGGMDSEAVLRLNTAATAHDVSLTGQAAQLLGTGELTTTGTFTWTGGLLGDTGITTIAAGATMLIERPVGPTYHFLFAQRTLRVAGTATWTRGEIDGSNGATVEILPGGLFDLPAGQRYDGRFPNVVNAGLLRVNREWMFITTMNNTGRVEVSPLGEPVVEGTLTNTGTIDVAAQGTFYANALTNLANNTLTGGTYLLRGRLDMPSADIQTNAATVVLDGTNAGIFEIQPARRDAFRNFTTNAAAGQFTIQNGYTVTISGRAFTNDGILTIVTPSTFTVSGGRFNPSTGTINGPVQLTNATLGSGTLSPAAIVIMTGGSEASDAVVVNQGLLVVQASVTFPGSFTNAPVGTLRAQGTNSTANAALTVAAGFTNAGAIELTSLNSSAYGAGLTVSAGILTNTGSITALAGSGDNGRALNAQLDNQGTLTANASLTVGLRGDSTNSGAIHVAGANLTINQLAAGATLTNAGSGTVTIDTNRTLTIIAQSTNSLRFNPGTGLAGTGVLALTYATLGSGTLSPTGTVILFVASEAADATLVNQGLLVVHAGTNVFNGAFTNAPGGTLRLEGTDSTANAVLVVSSGFTNAGAIELTSTSTSYPASLIVSTGTLTNTGSITALAGSGGSARSLNAQLDNQSTLTANYALTVSLRGDSTNSGAINVTGANLTVTQSGTNPSFTNSGTINVQLGTLSLSGNFMQNGGGTRVAAGATLTSNSTVNLLGGTLSGSGRVIGNVNNSGGQVNPGEVGAAGVLTIQGNYIQSGAGVLNIAIGGPNPGDYGQLVITGTATLGGTLNVSLINGFTPDSGATLQIMTFSSHGTSTFDTTNLDASFQQSPIYDPMDVTIVAN